MSTSWADLAGNSSGRRLLVAALLLAGLGSAVPAAGHPAEKFEAGVSRTSFNNVNVNDATAAYRVFIQQIGHRNGHEVAADVTIYEDVPRFAAAIERGTMHVAVMDAWQFMELERLREIRPYFVPTVNGQIGRKFVVLVRRGSGFRTLGDLRGRAVVRLESLNNQVCRHWLETLLPDDPAHPVSEFFEGLESATKATAAVLPVYFGQKTACIVDENGFELMKELNPDVGKSLEAIATSDRFVDGVICLGEQGWISPEAKADTIDSLGNLAADPAGRQVLILFKISGLVAFQEEQIATVRALHREANARKSPAARRPEAVTSSPGPDAAKGGRR